MVIPAQPFRTCALVAIGIVSVGVAFMSSRLDGFTFYLLASGSIVLAILIAAAVLDMILTDLRGCADENVPRCGACFMCSSQERTSGSREVAIMKPVS